VKGPLSGKGITLIIRLIIGGVFAYSGWEKLMSPVENFIAVIDQYQFIPANLIPAVAFTVPWLALIFGVYLVLGFVTRVSAIVLSVLLVVFVTLLGRAIAMNLPITECGCFGSGVTLAPHQALILDSVLLIAAVLVVSRPPTHLSLDQKLHS